MRTKSGIVISDTNDKTIVVKVDRYAIHPIYKKRYRVSKKFHAHDEQNEAKIGDIVEISECRPLSKLKCWKLEKIVAKSAQAIVKTPGAVESEEEAELKAIAQKEKKVSVEKSQATEVPKAKAPKKTAKK